MTILEMREVMNSCQIKHVDRNNAISLIRLVSLGAIFTCHIMQSINIELAWWFNVGVQIFLCMSGFLYGQRQVEDATRFYGNRLRKILIPYYLVFIPYGVLQFFLAKEVFDSHSFFLGLFLNSTIIGAGHLWFVSTILMCYLLTPLLAAYRDKYVVSKEKYLIFLFSSFGIISVFFGLFAKFYNPAWISCYSIGYSLGINENKKIIPLKPLVAIFGIIALVGNVIQIIFSYILHMSFGKYEIFCNYNHVMLGVFLFLLMWSAFDRVDLHSFSNMLAIADKYSYEMYLTHHFIILGPFSLMMLTGNVWINIGIIVLSTILLAILVKNIENRAYTKMKSVCESKFNWGGIGNYRSQLMGGSIIYIMFFHSTIVFSSFPIISKIKSYGNIGVDIFLILSAVGLYKSFSNNENVFCFYKRRLKRVLPATLMCMLPWFIYLYLHGRKFDNIFRIFLDVTSLSFWIDGNNRAWYIALALILYFIFPLLYFGAKKCVGKYNSMFYWGILSFGCILLNCLIAVLFPEYFRVVNLALRRLPTFLMGCAISNMVIDKKKSEYPVVLLSLLSIICAIFALEKYRYIFEPMAIWGYLYGISAFCIIVIICFWLESRNAISWLNKMLDFVGSITLELYLIHTQLLTVMEENVHLGIKGEIVIINIVAVIISGLLAYCLHAIIDKVFICSKKFI